MGTACCRLDPDPDSNPHLDPGYNKDHPGEKGKRKRQRRTVLAKRCPRGEVGAAGKIQAWWRGTLVRRTLLAAALRAWVIQVWWRALLWRRVQKLHQALLKIYVIQEQAAVRLQSCVRMCRCHQRYCQVRSTLCLLQDPGQCLPLQTRDWPQAQPAGAAKGLEFHVEILSI